MCSIMTGAGNSRGRQNCGCPRLHSIRQYRAAGKQGKCGGPNDWICCEKVFKRILIRNLRQCKGKLRKQIRNIRQRIRIIQSKIRIINLTRKSNENFNKIETKSNKKKTNKIN